MTMHERIMAGKLFTDMCEGMEEERLDAKKRMKRFNDSEPDDFEGRVKLMEEIFGKPCEAWIEPPFYFCYGRHITLGKGTYINVNCNFIDDGLITVGDSVMFGPAVTIATVGHPINPTMREYMYCDHVTIENNCWIGGGSIICPGVTIGENSVIGAGSVVTKNIPANCVAAGNPCKVIREINEDDMKYYYRDRPVTQEDLDEERSLRNNTYIPKSLSIKD